MTERLTARPLLSLCLAVLWTGWRSAPGKGARAGEGGWILSPASQPRGRTC